MSDTRHPSEYFTQLAQEVIEREPELEFLKRAPITIVYLESSHAKQNKGKWVLGQCEKVQEKNKWGIPADFTITIFEPNTAGMTEEQYKILLFHELLHIGADYKSTAPHDLEDFKVVIDRYGTDWAKHTDPRVNPVLN